ncbi:hypothetical protein [Thiobacillus denitrificans]|uniref:Uncharacterized protein n=1 Tax=Thiobacillus denitrificans TaxID=36861 RepID=A0A119CY99_THIDE|nr:hypothetical protein [Thiobacillus denitrificans]KVW99513.1 hypothetical protein ABW22_01460 [Thiobacillus denitrificans]
MSTQLAAAFGEMEARLATIRTVNGFNTNLGASVLPAGTYLSEEDAPCVALYEGRPDDEGLMRMAAIPGNACGLDFQVDYVVQAFVKRTEPQTALDAAEDAAQDILRALIGVSHGALTAANLHKITGRARGLTKKGADVIAVLVFGSFKVNEKVYQ